MTGTVIGPSFRRVGVLADDFSGAGDAALAFRAAGMTVEIWTPGGGRARAPFPKTRVWIIDTESRGLAPHAAAQAVRRGVGALTRWKADFIFKKIDSTLRGPVGAELAAFIDLIRPPAPVPFVPAFPRMGRTTVGGRLFVNGVPLHKTPFANDPRHPIRSNEISGILDASWSSGFQRQNVATRECVWVADVANERTLSAAARRALGIGAAVGSAGFAAALARQMGRRQKVPRQKVPVIATGPVGVVVGSAHPHSGRQLARLKNFLSRSDVFLLERPPLRGSPARVLRTLVSRARALEKAHGIRRWVVTGGETAFALARLWKTPRWRVADQIESGVPLCVSVGPRPRVLVTKPGGFGSPDALWKATRRLWQKEK